MEIKLDPRETEKIIKQETGPIVAAAIAAAMPKVLSSMVEQLLTEKVGSYSRETRLEQEIRKALQTVVSEETKAWCEQHAADLREEVRKRLATKSIEKMATSMADSALRSLTRQADVSVRFVTPEEHD